MNEITIYQIITTLFILAVIFYIIFSKRTIHKELPVKQIEKQMLINTNAKSKFTIVNGVKMHYLEAGKGEPMILIHGWLCYAAFWKPILAELSKKYHIYAIDLIGHGLSEKSINNKINYNTENQAKWIIEFMKKKNIENAYVVGHSMGGETAAKIAILAPDIIKKLVLLCAVGLEENPKLIPLYLRLINDLPVRAPLKWFFSKSIVIPSVNLCLYKNNKINDAFANDIILFNTNRQQDASAIVKTTKDGLFQDFIDERAKNINIPTLCLWAENDDLVPVKLGEQYHKLIKNSILEVIPKAGHLVPWEKPKQVISSITSFCT